VDEVMPGAAVDVLTGAAVTTGAITGAAVLKELIVGDTPSVGTSAPELTPRLLISVEPSGIPARAMPPGTVGEVGVDEDATLLEPEPHIPDIPDVSRTPDGVDIPELCSMPELADRPDVAEGSIDRVGEAAVVPADMPVAGMELPGVIPPPSKLADEPNMPAEDVPNVAHGVPLPGTAIVPVGLIGAGLTPADMISVAPSGIPVPPTAVPLVTSRGEVVLTDGVGMTTPCAIAMLLTRSIGSAAAITESFTDVLR
jgi:hypothetical protein